MTRRRHQIRIVRADGLRDVLERVKELCGGTDRSAAKALGIGQTTFTRLRTGRTREYIRADTYAAIHDALDGHAIEFGLIDLFEDSVLSGEAWLVVPHYQSWAQEERARLEALGAKEMLDELWEGSYRHYFESLLKAVGGDGELPQSDEHRLWIALYRTVEPFTAVSATWGVERSWRELLEEEEEDLGFYLRAATARERALLSRERVMDRVRSRNLTAPEDIIAGLAGLDEE